MAYRSHRTQTSPTILVVAGLTALAAHAVAALVVRVEQGPIDIDEVAARVAEVAERERLAAEPRPEPSCDGNVVLGTAARMAYCLSPVAGEGCVGDALDQFELGIITCSALVFDYETKETRTALVREEDLSEIEAEEMFLLDPSELIAEQEQRELAAAAPPPPPPPQQQQPPPRQQPPQRPPEPTQIVEVTEPESKEPPPDTRFLSDFDSRVEKQTVARGSTEEMVARPQPKELPTTAEQLEPTASDDGPDAPPGDNPDAPPEPGTMAMRDPGPLRPAEEAQEAATKGLESGSDAPVGEGGYLVKRGDAAFTREQREQSETPPGQDGGGGGKPRVPNLRPDEQVLERVVGGGSVDHLKDVAIGDVTALNTKGWVHASFFNRVKRMVAQKWSPARVYLQRDPHGNVYGVKDRHTLVRVSLTSSGEVANVYVLRPSGVEALDEEAMRAFRAAGPFPNPPAALVDADSRLITFNFGFYFEIDARGRSILR